MTQSVTIDRALIQLCAREREVIRRRGELIEQCGQAGDLIEDLDRDQDRLDREITHLAASAGTDWNNP